MDSYSSTTSYTDSSASYSFSSTHHFPHQEIKNRIPSAAAAALHSVRKHPITKSTTIGKKLHIAPMPPTPPKVYKVDPMEFKDVVQKLTGAIEFQPRRLREVAPPPLSLSPPPHRNNFVQQSGLKPLSPLGFSLSPSSLAWCKAMLLSPETISSFEPSLVL